MKCVAIGILLVGLGALGVRTDAHAAGRLADVQIIDRDTGAALPIYRHHGESWVAGRPGARYSIMIQNHRGERLLAVTAVDGINVISGETGAWGQSGYVFTPGESYEIAGWRKSNAEIAAFNFTSAANSYAERTGRPANVGVIGVALFLERPAPVQSYVPSERRFEQSSAAEDRADGAAIGGPPASRSQAAPAPRLAEVAPNSAASNMLQQQKLGTGHGAREASYVQNTTFDRLSTTPNEIIKIRYDSYENLVAMGVVPTHPVWQTPNPFPDSSKQTYVPDPPGG